MADGNFPKGHKLFGGIGNFLVGLEFSKRGINCLVVFLEFSMLDGVLFMQLLQMW